MSYFLSLLGTLICMLCILTVFRGVVWMKYDLYVVYIILTVSRGVVWTRYDLYYVYTYSVARRSLDEV
jgi:hypothetical protein